MFNDKCGVAAAYCSPEAEAAVEGGAAAYVQKMLLRLQHRGQQSAGLTTHRPGRGAQLLDTHRDVGLVSEVFRLSSPVKHQSLMSWYAGPACIGHVRYATSGNVTRAAAQPFETHGMRTWDWFAFAFNGNLANFVQLRRRLEERGHRNIDVDTEVLRHLLWSECGVAERPDVVEVFRRVVAHLDGGYALVFLNADGDLVAVRDPLGLRPICYGQRDGMLAVASESTALATLGIDDFRSLEPGHLLHVTREGHHVHQVAVSERHAHCYFEWVYFSDAGSVLEGRSVYDVRYRLGAELAEIEPLRGRFDDSFIVVPVPETSKAAADGLAHALGIPMMEGIHSNRYIGRTFIKSADRESSAREKYVLIPQILKGKKVLLVEDTVVRGLTARVLLTRLRREGGVAEVHMRVSCPPHVSPCCYGIDMTTMDEFVAARFAEVGKNERAVAEHMREEVGADTFVYQSYEGLIRAIGLPESDLCDACLTGRYPTPWGNKVREHARARQGSGDVGRSYEDMELVEEDEEDEEDQGVGAGMQ